MGGILGLTFQERESSLKIDAESYNAMLLDLRAKLTQAGQSELAGLIAEPEAVILETVSGPDIDRLITLRTACRDQKQYALADEIRGRLQGQGVWVEDSAAGSVWEYRPTS